MAVMGGAALFGAASLFYLGRRAFGSSAATEDDAPCTLPEVTMPGIVSDIDGVVVNGKNVVPGSKETLIKLLTPSKQTKRRVPFTFLSNGGGYYEHQKADKMNKQLGLG